MFSVIDWVIVVLFLAVMLGIGFVSARRTKSEEDFSLGGRSMNSVFVGLSMFATTMSTLSYLSFPGEMIKYGPAFFFGCLGYPLAYFVVKRFLIPRFMEMNATSAYEILEMKLGRGTRVLATTFFLTLRFLWMSTVVYATVSTALVPIFGVSPDYIAPISVILMVITVIYSSAGGLKAVVTTDAIQTIVMFIGAVLALVLIICKLGPADSLSNPVMTAHWDPIRWGFDPVSRLTVFNIIMMRFSWQVCTSGSDQMLVQRYLATKDIKSAAHSYKISLICNTCIELLLAAVGFFVLAYFFYTPEMMADGTTIAGDADKLFPRFILVGMPKGLTGLIAAALMAAAMSSLSSGLNSCSTVIEEDIVKKIRSRKGKDNGGSLKRIKLVSVLLGVAVTIACFFVGYVPGNLMDLIMKVVNLVTAPLFVLFFMALFVKSATDAGTIIGGLCAFAVAIAIAFFGLFGLQAIWVMPVSFVIGILTAWAASRFSRILKR